MSLGFLSNRSDGRGARPGVGSLSLDVVVEPSSSVAIERDSKKDASVANEQFTLALIVPLVAAIPATFGAYAELRTDAYVDQLAADATQTPWIAYTPLVWGEFREPFSTLTNVATWAGGLAVIASRFLRNAPLSSSGTLIAFTLSFVGAGSYAWHHYASGPGWQHFVDVLGTYVFLIAAACVGPNAVYHAYVAKRPRPRSVATLVSNLLTFVLTAVTIRYYEELDPHTTLFSYGAVIVTCNGIVALILDYRQRSSLWRAVFGGCLVILIECAIFGSGYVLTMTSFDTLHEVRKHRNEKQHKRMTAWLHAQRVRYDIVHGMWHVLAASFLLLTSLILIEGINAGKRNGVGIFSSVRERVSALLLATYPCALLLFVMLDVDTAVLLALFATLQAIVLVACAGYALYTRTRGG